MHYISKSLCTTIILLIISFTSQAQEKQIYPLFFYNGKPFHEQIINRFPHYGISGKDGCTVLGEIMLELNDVGKEKIAGMVRDATTKKTLLATVILLRQDGSKDTLNTKQDGKLLINRASLIKELQIDAVFPLYRRLKIQGAPGLLL